MTDYVVAILYGAPDAEYSAGIDVWYVGCIYMILMNRKLLKLIVVLSRTKMQ